MKKTTYVCPICDKELEALEDDEKITFECEDCKLIGTLLK